MKYFEYKGKQYPFVFNINVVSMLQEKYGTFNKWANLIEPEDDMLPNMKALFEVIAMSINEGIDIENEEKNEERPFVGVKFVGRLVNDIGWKNAFSDLMKDFHKNSRPSEEEDLEEEKKQITP